MCKPVRYGYDFSHTYVYGCRIVECLFMSNPVGIVWESAFSFCIMFHLRESDFIKFPYL
jgi:hypothetical protein